MSPGERAERAKRRRFWAVIGALVFVGAVTGGVIGAAEGEFAAQGGSFLQASIPAWLAITLTVVYLLSIGGGTALMLRNMDEHSRTESLWFSAYGASTYLVAYPVWFLLWKGEILPEPHHLVLFLIFYVGAVVGYVARQFATNRTTRKD